MKLFVVEMSTTTKITNLLQSFCGSLLDLEVILKIVVGPDDTRHGRVNPSKAEATFIQSPRTLKSLKTI